MYNIRHCLLHTSAVGCIKHLDGYMVRCIQKVNLLKIIKVILQKKYIYTLVTNLVCKESNRTATKSDYSLIFMNAWNHRE